MKNRTARSLANQIENKLREVQEQKRDLKELEQDLKEEIERVGKDERESRNGRSVRWEEIEWDIHCTETAIRCISEEVEKLREQLHELTRSRERGRIANE